MGDIKKKIVLNPNDIISASIHEGFAVNEYSITRFYIIGNNTITFRICLWDDIAFRAFIKEDDVNNVEFEFTITDPFYFYLNSILNKETELVIDDDEISCEKQRCMILKKDEYKIKVIFLNTLDKDKYYPEEKFRVFIKNIAADPRSKIEDNTIKYRIVKYLRELTKYLIEGYRDMTIDEYLELINYQKEKQKILRRD